MIGCTRKYLDENKKVTNCVNCPEWPLLSVLEFGIALHSFSRQESTTDKV